jgi:hypothetical protein
MVYLTASIEQKLCFKSVSFKLFEIFTFSIVYCVYETSKYISMIHMADKHVTLYNTEIPFIFFHMYSKLFIL